MIRQVIRIDEELCNGCMLCTQACHEGAIIMVDGKAKLIRDDYCDGLGNCLPACPTGAITFEMREAADFDEEAVKEHLANTLERDFFGDEPDSSAPFQCPSMTIRTFDRKSAVETPKVDVARHSPADSPVADAPVSNLAQWPVQLQLVNPAAPYFKDAHLLVAADCAAFAHASFNQTYMKNKVTIIGCPKLDYADYSEKIGEILKHNNIKSLTIVRMEVPCCGGLSSAAIEALRVSGKMIPWNVVTLGTDGSVREN